MKALNGEATDLKEQLLGIDVWRKFADWDSDVDATVRVAMSQLRNAVNAYYNSDGKDDMVLIILEPGIYAPEFAYRKNKVMPTPIAKKVARPTLVSEKIDFPAEAFRALQQKLADHPELFRPVSDQFYADQPYNQPIQTIVVSPADWPKQLSDKGITRQFQTIGGRTVLFSTMLKPKN